MRRILLATIAVVIMGVSMIVTRPETTSAATVVLPMDSAQCHWTNHVTNMVEHVHNDNGLPSRYPDVTGPFRVNFTNLLFHTSGYIGPYFVGNQKTSDAQDTLFWDDTQGARQPVEQGDAAGIAQWSGHFTITPGTLDANNRVRPVLHGWAHANSNAYAFFPDGATVKDILYEPYHSIIDLSVPEVLGNQDQYISAECQVNSTASSNDYGQQVVTIETVLPTSIGAPYTLQYSTYNYGNNFSAPEPETSDVILDPDFHHCVIAPLNPNCAGTTLATITTLGAADLVSQRVVLDPAKMGPAGLHKIAVRRCQPNHGDTLCTLAVFGIITTTGGEVLPPPPLPPPPPPPVAITQPVFGQELNGVLSICVKDATHCVTVP